MNDLMMMNAMTYSLAVVMRACFRRPGSNFVYCNSNI